MFLYNSYKRWPTCSVMSSRGNCRKLVVHTLWFVCCTACLSSLAVVFLSVQCLEDHQESHDLKKEKNPGGYKTLFHPTREGARFGLTDVLKENRELRSIIRQLRQRLSRENSSENLLSGLLRVPAVNPRHIIESWHERRLKYIAGEGPRSMPSRDIVLNCKEVSRIHVLEEIGRGYTKVTQRGIYNGLEVAVKSAGLDSTDVQRCMKEKRAKIIQDCMVFSRYKIMKELLLYQQIDHPNIVKLLGYCLQSDKNSNDIKSRGLTVVTELGSPVDLMAVLQMPWHQRFRVAVGLARLIHFFSISPLGSLVIRDFQLTQFVLVDGEIKLSDLDDVGNEAQLCDTSNDCFLGNTTLKCLGNVCQDYNEKWNIYNFHRFYLSLFLLPRAPDHVRVELEKITNEAGLLDTDSKALFGDLERVLTTLRTGEGLNTTIKDDVKYKAVARADFPGRHDYWCSQSLSFANCQFLAFNETEAKQRCNKERQCKAFVMSYEKSWTGYRSVYLKNATSGLIFSESHVVYIKVT